MRRAFVYFSLVAAIKDRKQNLTKLSKKNTILSFFVSKNNFNFYLDLH